MLNVLAGILGGVGNLAEKQRMAEALKRKEQQQYLQNIMEKILAMGYAPATAGQKGAVNIPGLGEGMPQNFQQLQKLPDPLQKVRMDYFAALTNWLKARPEIERNKTNKKASGGSYLTPEVLKSLGDLLND